MSLLKVQTRLKALGHDPGPLDGKYGRQTEAAIMAALDALPAPETAAIDPRALALIKAFEGFEDTAYRDGGGVWTIGFGTTAAAGVGIEPAPGMTITRAEAETYLARALDKFAAQIIPAITAPTTPAQLGAMLSLAYNIGPSAFLGSTLLRKFNAGDVTGAADEFTRWNRDNGEVLSGLVRRRAAERELFLSA